MKRELSRTVGWLEDPLEYDETVLRWGLYGFNIGEEGATDLMNDGMLFSVILSESECAACQRLSALTLLSLMYEGITQAYADVIVKEFMLNLMGRWDRMQCWEEVCKWTHEWVHEDERERLMEEGLLRGLSHMAPRGLPAEVPDVPPAA